MADDSLLNQDRKNYRPEQPQAETPQVETPAPQAQVNPDPRIDRLEMLLNQYIHREPVQEKEPEPERQYRRLPWPRLRLVDGALIAAIAGVAMYANDPLPKQNQEAIKMRAEQLHDRVDRLDSERGDVSQIKQDIRDLDDRTWRLKTWIQEDRKKFAALKRDVTANQNDIDDLKFNRATLIKWADQLKNGARSVTMWLSETDDPKAGEELVILK